MISPPPIRTPLQTPEGALEPAWLEWLNSVHHYLRFHQLSGPTTGRPTNGIQTGDYYFDTTLGYPIWYDGTNWVNASGSTV